MANATSNTPVTPAPVVNTPKSTGITGSTRKLVQDALSNLSRPPLEAARANTTALKSVLTSAPNMQVNQPQNPSKPTYIYTELPSKDGQADPSDKPTVDTNPTDTTPTGTSGTDSTPTDNSNEGQSKEADAKTLSVKEAQEKVAEIYEKLKNGEIPDERTLDFIEGLSEDQKKEVKESIEKAKKYKGKKDNPAEIGTHNADEEKGDDEKFKIQEGDIIDWMMKEVILASAEWAGNKLAKGTGLLLAGGLEGAGKISKSGAEWTWEKAKYVYKYITKDKVYPTDTTGNACKEADEMAKQYSEATKKVLTFPWEKNSWENDDTKKEFTDQINNGQLYDVAFKPISKEAHEIDISSMDDIKKTDVISPEFRNEMISIMIDAPDKVDGVDENKIKAIKDALTQENGPDLHAMKTIVDSLTKEEKEKYNESLKETLKAKVGNVDDYIVKKIKEQKETQDVYNQAKTDRYYQAIADGDKDTLENVFIGKNNSKHMEKIEESVEQFKNKGASEKEAWENTSTLMRNYHESIISKNNFASLYASTMLKQKHIEGGANTNEETRKAEFNELLKEGRAVYRVAEAGGMAGEMSENLIKASKQQESDLLNGKYIENTKKQPKENKYLEDVASLSEYVKDKGKELIGKEGISLQQEAKNQNEPIDNYTMDDLGKCKTLAEDWKAKRAQNKAHIKSILYGANQYTGQNVYIPNQKGRGN